MVWDVRLLAEVEQWLLALDDNSYDQVAAAIDKLESDGPTLGRPLVDRVEGSRHHSMKDLTSQVGRQERGSESRSCSTPKVGPCC